MTFCLIYFDLALVFSQNFALSLALLGFALEHVSLLIFKLNIPISFILYKHSVYLASISLEDSTSPDSTII